MDHKAKKVIFIGGSSYSGSTMLDMMMANNPDGFSVGEVHALFHPYRPHHFNPECGCSNPKCDFWFKVRKEGKEHLYETIFTLLPDISFIVDSSKNPWWIQKQSDLLERQGIEVYHLLIWKEPASFAHSMLKRNQKNWEKAWKNYYRLYLTLFERYISIPYSDLAQFPEQVLREVCSKCGLTYHEGMEKFWEKQHHTLFGNDSAKIHLHGDDLAIKHQSSLFQSSVQGHRTIYHDTSYLKSLSPEINQVIEADPNFNNILLLLNGARNSDISLETFRFPSRKVAEIKVRHQCRSLLGKLFGRFWRIF